MKAVESSERSDGDDEILARLAFRLGRRPLAHAVEPVGYGQDLQLAFFQPAQIGGGMKDSAKLVGVALVQAVEIILDHGFDGRSVMAHGGSSDWLIDLFRIELSHEQTNCAMGGFHLHARKFPVAGSKNPNARILAGECFCGTVRYAVADAFAYALNCHCSNCRRTTGSAFKPFAGIERENSG
jgi:Uncharacterized conserved protein